MRINSFPEMEELAKRLVKMEMGNLEDPDELFEKQTTESIFYKVYNDICGYNQVLAASFAIHLKEKYEIDIIIR